jgi:hypothetical protein
MRSGSILIIVALLCFSSSVIAQEGETSSGDHEVTSPDGAHHEVSVGIDHGVMEVTDHHSGPDMAPNGPGGVDHRDPSGRGGISANPTDLQNSINEVTQQINDIKARRDAIAQEELDLLNERDADFAAGLEPEWNSKMDELKGEMALVYGDLAKEMELLRDLQSAGQGDAGGGAGSQGSSTPAAPPATSPANQQRNSSRAVH